MNRRTTTRRNMLGKASLALAGLPILSGAATPRPTTGHATLNGLDARVIMLKPGERLPIEDGRHPHRFIPMDRGCRLAIVSDGIGAGLARNLDIADGIYDSAGRVRLDRTAIEREILDGIAPA